MKRAIVISGGGSKRAYAAGVLDKFRESESQLKFDVFVGTKIFRDSLFEGIKVGWVFFFTTK